MVRSSGDSAAPSRRRLPRTWLVLCAVLVALSAAAPAVSAQTQEPGSRFRSGSDVVIEAGEHIPHDLYVAGGTIRVDGSIDGDLLVAGGQITVNGPVSGDLWAAGRSISVRSDVGGDARLAGDQVTVEGKVGEDLLAGASDVTLAPTANVAGDFLLGSGRTHLDGTVQGDVMGSTGDYQRRGTVGGREQVKVEKGRRRAEAPPTPADRLLKVLRRYVSVVLVGVLLLWLFPVLLASAVRMLRERPLPSFGAGILGIAGFAVAFLALAVATGLVAVVLGLLTLGSLTAAAIISGIVAVFVLFLAFFLTLVFIGDVLVGIAVGRLLVRPKGEPSRVADLAALAVGVAVLAVLWAIPVVGGLVRIVTALAGLGALLLLVRERRRAGQPPPAVATAQAA